MAANRARGSIILEILIILAALLLVAVLILPNKIWKEEQKITEQSRANMTTIYEAERYFYSKTGNYTDTLSNLLTFVQNDSDLQQRKTVVSLTRDFMQVIDNVLSLPSLKQVSSISQAGFEITGDLLGNERYFRRNENIANLANEINREMSQLDSSETFPNFNKIKLFVDSLRNIRDNITDFTLQNGNLFALNYTDSLLKFLPSFEKDAFNQYWKAENSKITNLISQINKTDIVKVSSVQDRLKKFIDRIDEAVNTLNNVNLSQDLGKLQQDRGQLNSLHDKFISSDYFLLTKHFGQVSLNESDSLLIHFSESEFLGPDSKKPYLISYSGSNLTVESPNLLDEFHEKFVKDVEPVKNLPFVDMVDQLDTVIAHTQEVMNNNRKFIRRNTDLLLSSKEIEAEFGDISNVFFYKYTHEFQNFVKTIQTEKKLSVVKPMIEDILNPMDTLATRIRNNDISDLESKVMSYDKQLKHLDSLIQASRLSSRTKRRIQSNAEAFQPAIDLLGQIKSSFDPAFADKLEQVDTALEKDLLNALEGREETVDLIFRKKHINHGAIVNGEKSWEAKK